MFDTFVVLLDCSADLSTVKLLILVYSNLQHCFLFIFVWDCKKGMHFSLSPYILVYCFMCFTTGFQNPSGFFFFCLPPLINRGF